ncbi:hypothetical protein D3C75_875850 [compost metagenome]
MLISKRKRKLKKAMNKTKPVLIFFALATPIILYFLTFNKSLSVNSQDWGAFGSFIGGVYAPIAAIISVYVLIKTLHVMENNSKESSEHQIKERHLENIRWLTDLLRDMLNKKYILGHSVCYKGLKLALKKKLENIHNPDISVVKNKAIEIMKENKEIFQDESIIFDDLFYRVTRPNGIDDEALGCMILIAKLSPEERFWLMQYAKAHDLRAPKDLKFWRGFEDLPQSLSSLIRS